MKKIIFTILMFSFIQLVLGQTKTQSIELPDFVITGIQNVSLPKIQKKQPDFISLLSKDFFNPTFPGEEEIPLKMPEIKIEQVSVFNQVQKTNALIKVSAGKHTWPSGEFYYNNWKNNFSYNLNLYGLRELNYIENAGVNYVGGKLGGRYFIDKKADFLPGLEINLNGSYKIESFNFFGSKTPSVNRKLDFGNGVFSLNYDNKSSINFGLSIRDDYYNQKDDDINENVITSIAYVQYKIRNLVFDLNGTFKNQSLTTLLPNLESRNFYNTTATIGVAPFKNFFVKGGLYFSKSGTETLISPLAFASLRMSENFTLFGEFSPYAELLTLKDFVLKNRYYNLDTFANSFVKNKTNLKVALRFDYNKNIEITSGGGVKNSTNSIYFIDNIKKGFFNIYNDDIKNTYVFVDILLRQSKLGDFYAELKVQDVEGSSKKKIPYAPTFLAKLSHLYNWSNNFGTRLDLDFTDGMYFNKENTGELPRKVNLSFSLYYEVFNNLNVTLQLENILNNKYYYYNSYEAKPFDALLGFEFRW